MIENPLISIVTIVYNGESILEKTIQSVINQTYENIEYIIVDGASTDGTVCLIKKYENRISKWISEPDNGLYDAMNKGAMLATGDFINFLNADDILYTENTIKDAIQHINNINIGYYGRANIISEKVCWTYPNFEVKNYKKWLKLNLPNHQTMLFPKKFYKNFKYDLRLKIGADDDYKLYAIENFDIQFIDIVFVEFHRGGISTNHNNISFFIQRMKESFIRNYKHKKWIRFILDPFKLILMYFVSYLFGEDKFNQFIKIIVKLKG